MQGKVCLITGANTGIGLETARGLAERGATVILASRDATRGQEALDEVRRSTGSESLSLLTLDLADLASVRAAAAEVQERYPRLDVLVNNAGLVLDERRATKDGFEMTFGVNHLGHYLLTRLLWDRLVESAPARVVNLSSDGHRASRGLDFDDLMYERRRYAGMGAYCDSKLANVLFTRALHRRLQPHGVTAYAVHPGVVATRFARDGDVKGWMGWLVSLGAPFLRTPARGAETSLYCAADPAAADHSGGYFANRKHRKPARAALDEAAAERLWEVSARLVGLPTDPDPY